MGVDLDPQEQSVFIAESHTGILTTLRRDGSPVALPVWFVELDGCVYVASPPGAAKVRRVRNDERCWFLVERGRAWTELAAVGFAGSARVLAPGPEAERAAAALRDKYAAFRPPVDGLPAAMRRHYAEQVLIRIERSADPISWNNAKARPSRS